MRVTLARASVPVSRLPVSDNGRDRAGATIPLNPGSAKNSPVGRRHRPPEDFSRFAAPTASMSHCLRDHRLMAAGFP